MLPRPPSFLLSLLLCYEPLISSYHVPGSDPVPMDAAGLPVGPALSPAHRLELLLRAVFVREDDGVGEEGGAGGLYLGASPWVSLDVKPRIQRAQVHEVYFLFPPLGTLTCLRTEPPSGREPFTEHGISALQHTETEISVALASFTDRCSHAPRSCRQLHSGKSFCSHWLRAS